MVKTASTSQLIIRGGAGWRLGGGGEKEKGAFFIYGASAAVGQGRLGLVVRVRARECLGA